MCPYMLNLGQDLMLVMQLKRDVTRCDKRIGVLVLSFVDSEVVLHENLPLGSDKPMCLHRDEFVRLWGNPKLSSLIQRMTERYQVHQRSHLNYELLGKTN